MLCAISTFMTPYELFSRSLFWLSDRRWSSSFLRSASSVQVRSPPAVALSRAGGFEAEHAGAVHHHRWSRRSGQLAVVQRWLA